MASCGSGAELNHKLLQQDNWSVTFTNYYQESSLDLLFTVSGGKTTGRMFGFVFSAGISAAAKGNRLTEMSVKARGEGAEDVIKTLTSEYQLCKRAINIRQVKSTIRLNGWHVVKYQYDQSPRRWGYGHRVHIILQKLDASPNQPPGVVPGGMNPPLGANPSGPNESMGRLDQTPKLAEFTYLDNSNGEKFVKVTSEVGQHWKELAGYFQLSDGTIHTIQGFEPSMACEKVFDMWLKGGTREYRQPKNWNTVLRGIKRVVGDHLLADKIHDILTT